MEEFEEPDEAADVSDDERFFSMLGGQADPSEDQIEQDMTFLSSIPDTADLSIRIGEMVPGDVIGLVDDYVDDAQFDQVITDGEDNQEDFTEDAAFDEVIDGTELSHNALGLPPGHGVSPVVTDPEHGVGPVVTDPATEHGVTGVPAPDVTDFVEDAAFDELIKELDDADYLDDANFDEVLDDSNLASLIHSKEEDDYAEDANFDEVINEADLDILHAANTNDYAEDAAFDETVDVAGIVLSGSDFSSIQPQSMVTEGVQGLIQQVHGITLEDSAPKVILASPVASPAYSPHLQTKGITSSMQSINLSDSVEVLPPASTDQIPSGISVPATDASKAAAEASKAATELPKPLIPDSLTIPTPKQQQPSPVTTPTSYFNSSPSIIQPLSSFPSDDAATSDPSEPGIDSELWLPNSDTLELLRQSSVAPLDAQYLTQAAPSNETLFVNPAVELVLKYQGESAAAKLNKPLPATGHEGLRQLIKQGRLMSALNMLTEMLTNTTMSPKIIQLWAIRFALLVKLKLYSNAEVEMSMFGTLETVDLYYEYYPSEWLNRRGSIIPWSMRLLWAILPLHSNSSGGLYGAVDRMYGIVDHLDIALLAGLPYAQEQRVIKYKVSVLVQISGVLAGSGGMQPAIKVLNQLKTLQPSLSNVVTSAMARLFFQLGNIAKGDEMLASVAASLTPEEGSMNAGFSSLAHGNYSEAYQHFARVCSINPSNTVASNNGAVCLLYLGRLSDSIAQFESAVTGSLHPMLLFNLVSLYELQTASSTNKKCKLLETLTLTDRDGFPYECLRL